MTARLAASQRRYATAREAVHTRAKGVCERCECRPAAQVHHRIPRGAGGSSRNPAVHRLSALVALCEECHALVESQRAAARECGLLLWRSQDPEAVPVTVGLDPYARMVMLYDDGTKEDV